MNGVKICLKCKSEQSLDKFNASKKSVDGLHHYCKKCNKAYCRHHYESNKDYYKRYFKKNYYGEKRVIAIQRSIDWNKNNKKKRNSMRKDRYRNDPLFKLSLVIRRRIWMAMRNNYKKAFKTIELLCTDVGTAKKHIESQFSNSMSWDNYGQLWQIDHIIPISFFNMNDPTEQKLAFHYANQRPMLKNENLVKHNSLEKSNFRY